MPLDRGAAPVGSSPFHCASRGVSVPPSSGSSGGLTPHCRPAESGGHDPHPRWMPVGVLGLEAVDDVEKQDYENVVAPVDRRADRRARKARLVYVLVRSSTTMRERQSRRTRLGVRHPASFERMAIVTDARWAGPAIKIFSVLWPGQARAFPLADLESAKRWAAGTSQLTPLGAHVEMSAPDSTGAPPAGGVARAVPGLSLATPFGSERGIAVWPRGSVGPRTRLPRTS